MTRSDLVMVEREVLERAHGHLCKIAGTEAWTHNNLDGWQVTPGALREYAESAAKELDRALQSVEGGVQGSIATKQESCPESAPRTETAVRFWRKSVFTYEHDDAAGHLYYFAPQVTAPGPFLEQRRVQAIVDIASDGTFAGVELIDKMPPLESGAADTKSDGGTSPSNETRGGTGDDCSVGKRGAWPHHDGQVCAQRSNVENQNPDVTGGESAAPNSDQLTKTPSADHDAGNLRGLAVQGSIATKRATNGTSASATETAINILHDAMWRIHSREWAADDCEAGARNAAAMWRIADTTLGAVNAALNGGKEHANALGKIKAIAEEIALTSGSQDKAASLSELYKVACDALEALAETDANAPGDTGLVSEGGVSA